jgi:hypothetical protein
MEDQKFRDTVITQLAELQVGQKTMADTLNEIKDHLDSLSGRVSDTERNLLLHPSECPIKELVFRLERDIVSGNHPGAKDTIDRVIKLEGVSNILRAYKRLAWALLFLNVILALIHAPELLKYGLSK